MRLIDADAIDFAFPLPDNLEGMLKQIGIEMAKIRVSLAPTIEAEPVRHGRWDASGRYRFKDGSLAIRCNVCGAALHDDEWKKYHWHYCPNCGAKMDGDSDAV